MDIYLSTPRPKQKMQIAMIDRVYTSAAKQSDHRIWGSQLAAAENKMADLRYFQIW